jgi:hypothetical protein
MRILVTGSRDWPFPEVIAEELIRVSLIPQETTSKIVLVSGACPTGADRMAEDWAEKWGWEIERHPADWSRYGKSAGFRRNKEMVDLGARYCVAFIKNNSKGASMTKRLATEAGIETFVTEME